MPHIASRQPRKHRLLTVIACTTLALTSATVIHAQSTSSTQDLYQHFQNPPDDARPMMRWWWFGAAVEKPEILRELQQMKADGIGGVELAFVYPQVVDDTAKNQKNLPFLSPAFLDCVRYAQQQARALGLRVDVTLGSGWPYGGPATTLAEAAHRLRTFEVPVPPGTTSIPYPALAEGDKPIYVALVEGSPKHWDPATAKPLNEVIAGSCCPPQTEQFAPAPTPRTALFFVDSHTRQQVKRAAVGAEGWVLDPFSHEAVATHLKSVADPLLSAFSDAPPYAVFSDSLEAYGADWTPDLAAEFRKRRGYDLLPHLPELVAGGTPQSAVIRHDWGRTLTELVNENYLSQINSWAVAHQTRFRSQSYGEPAVTFSSQQLAALPEGEGPQWRAFSTLRWATSANHVFGNNVTSGETFTWLHSPVFRATPLDMKAEADIDFIMGENQIIGHGWPYSPPPAQLPPGDPGWSLYAAAALNDHNPWHPVMPAVTRYIQRVSYLLRQGKPANQVAILLPTDDAWAAFSPGKVTVTGALQKLVPEELMAAILSAGYNIDFIDADALNKVGLGDHQILVIPPTDRIPVETLKRLHPWYQKEGQVICYRRCPSLDPAGKPLPGLTGSFIFANDSAALVKALKNAAPPDLQAATPNPDLGFIRRSLPDADIYFVVNTSNRSITTAATFATKFKTGEAWNPDTGLAATRPVLASETRLDLAPYESRVLVFHRPDTGDLGVPPPERTLVDLSSNWHVTFPAISRSITEPTLTDWTADPATLHYSGEAIYTREVTLPSPLPRTPVYLTIQGGSALPGAPDTTPQEHVVNAADGLPNPLVTRTGPGMHAWYDPPIREAALVIVNGSPAGALWHPPYRLDISGLLKPGQNRIEIRVYNTALNAWSARPPRDYKPLIAKYGDRFQMQDLDKVAPLPSGILGTIQVVTGGAR